jgi:TP901 family phage tail tape measure protein
MAGRQTFIELELKTDKVKNGLKVVLSGLKAIQEEVSKINKDGLNFVNTSTTETKIISLTKAVATLSREYYNLKNASKEGLKAPKDDVLTKFIQLRISIEALGYSYQSLLSLFSKVDMFTKLEASVTNLNIASGKGISSFGDSMKEFLNLSSQIPKTADELVRTADALVRTGRSYKEAMEITKETAKLAVATGEDLEHTAKTVTKVMVSLGINSENTEKVLNILHSTAIQTASSMESISGGMNQVAGALGAIALSSNKTGESLEAYKKELLEVGAVGLGVMNNLGKSASESGTKIKVLFTRLVTMEKTAKNLFNTNVKDYKLDDKYMKALGTNSNVLNADVLSQLAKKDLPLAIELMSKLKVEGVLTSQTLQKMFTQRHALDLEVLLGQVNGDINNLVSNITQGKDYVADFESQMFTMTNQLQLFKQNLEHISADGMYYLGDAITGVAYAFNKLVAENPTSYLDDVARVFANIGGTVGFLGKTLLTTGIAFGQLNHYFHLHIKGWRDALNFVGDSLKSFISSWVSWVGIAITSISFIYYKIKKNQEEFIQSNLKTIQTFETINNTISGIKANMDKINLDRNTEYTFEFKTLVDLAFSENDLQKKIKELLDKQQDALKNSSEYKMKIKLATDIEANTKEYEAKVKEYKEKQLDILDKIEKEYYSPNNTMKINYGWSVDSKNTKIALDYMRAYMKNEQGMVEELSKAYSKLNEGKILDLTTATKIVAEFSTKGKGNLKQFSDELVSLNEKLQESSTKMQDLSKEIGEYQDDLRGSDKALELFVNTLNEDLAKSGKYFDPVTNKLYDIGKNATEVANIFRKHFNEKYNLNLDTHELDEAKQQLEAINIALQQAIGFHQIHLQVTKTILEKTIKDKEAENAYIHEHGKISFDEAVKFVTANKKNKKVNYDTLQEAERYGLEMQPRAEKRARLQYKIDTLPANKIYAEDRIALAKAKKEEETYKKAYALYIQEEENKKNAKTGHKKQGHKETEYKMEYVKLQERSLTLEQAIYLVGKEGLEKEYQQYLNKQQSLKLELDTLKATKERLSIENQKYIQKGANETDKAFMERIKDRIEAISAMGTLSGKNGQAIKEEQQELSKLYDSYMSYMNKFDNFAINSLSLLEKAIDSIKDKQYETIDSLISYKKELYSLNKLSDEDYFSTLSDNIELTGLKIEDIKSKLKNLNLSLLSRDMQDVVNNVINSDVINKQDLTIYAKLDFEDTKEIEKRLKELRDKQAKGLTLTQDEQKELETKILKLDTELKVREKLKLLQEKQVQKTREELELIKAKNEVAQKGFSQLAQFSKNSGTGKFGAGLGGLFEGLSNYANSMSEQGMKFLSPALQQFMSKMKDLFGRINADSQVGQALTSALGINNSTSQLFGSLGALGSNLLGFGGPAGMLTSTGLSLLGGIFGRKNKNRQAEADKKSEKARNQYNENTRQLQIVANRLESLNTNLLNLNQSMISIFSNMPTIDNIARITGGLEKLYGVINVNRDFGNVSYLTQESKTSGNWFTGKSTVTWLKNNQLSTQALLKEYGFNGNILDMSIKQLEDFSKWLKTYSKGIENNFKDYAKVVDNYVTSMINLKEMINKFAYRTTFEAFQGFSVSKQEDLVKNLTQIYKDAGVTITEGITQQIRELAKQMSVLVTIMSDVRKDFLTQWKDSGKTAGESFVGSMKPYVQALLNNMSQVYFDTVFSNSSKRLELQFKNIGDLLFNLKKQGRDLTWDKIASEMRKPFSNVIDLLREAKEKTDTFSSALAGLQKVAREKGMSFSEMSSLNLLTKTQQSMFENFKQGIQSTEMNSALTQVGTLVGNTIGEEMSKRLIDKFMSNKLTDLSEQLDKTLRGNMNLNDLSKISQMAMSTGLQLETERRKLTAIRDMFNFNKDINYQNNNNEIKYETGTSQTVINNFYITGQVNAGVVIPQAEVKQFVQATINDTIEVLNTDKGIDLKKLI